MIAKQSVRLALVVASATLSIISVVVSLQAERIARQAHDASLRHRIDSVEWRVTAIERGHRIKNGIETCTTTPCPICNLK